MRLRSRAFLRQYIALAGMTEREVARSAGISHSTLNHLLTGRRDTCSPATAGAIEDVLGSRRGVFFRSD